MRARDTRRQGGRFGETYQARDHAVKNLLAQAKGIGREGGLSGPPACTWCGKTDGPCPQEAERSFIQR